MRTVLPFFVILIFAPATWSQTASGTPPQSPRVDSVLNVDPGNMYYRIYAVVPLVGTGQQGDPKRPMFVPAQATKDRSGIIGWQMTLSDDKNSAIVEFVGVNRAALLPIITSTAAGVTVFERGKTAPSAIETAFQAYKTGFTLSSWIPVRPQ